MSYEDKINLYGAGPIVVAFLIYLPVLFVKHINPRRILNNSYAPLFRVDEIKNTALKLWTQLAQSFQLLADQVKKLIKKNQTAAPETEGEKDVESAEQRNEQRDTADAPIQEANDKDYETQAALQIEGAGNTENDSQEELEEIEKQNAHVRQRVWFWLLFWYDFTTRLLPASERPRVAVGDKRYLLIDFSIECPLDHTNKPLFWKVLVILLVYPLGLPIFFYWTLWRHEIPRLASVKFQNLLFVEVLKEFKSQMSEEEASEAMLSTCVKALLKESEEPHKRNRLLLDRNLSVHQLEMILEHEWFKASAAEMEDKEKRTDQGSQEIRNNRNNVLNSLKHWSKDVDEHREVLEPIELQRRKAWCKIVYNWIESLDNCFFEDKYVIPVENENQKGGGKKGSTKVQGKNFHMCIFYINNNLFNEARHMIIQGQDIISRWHDDQNTEDTKAESFEPDVVAVAMNFILSSFKSRSGPISPDVTWESANDALRALRFWLRIRETLWVYGLCTKLDDPNVNFKKDPSSNEQQADDSFSNCYTSKCEKCARANGYHGTNNSTEGSTCYDDNTNTEERKRSWFECQRVSCQNSGELPTCIKELKEQIDGLSLKISINVCNDCHSCNFYKWIEEEEREMVLHVCEPCKFKFLMETDAFWTLVSLPSNAGGTSSLAQSAQQWDTALTSRRRLSDYKEKDGTIDTGELEAAFTDGFLRYTNAKSTNRNESHDRKDSGQQSSGTQQGSSRNDDKSSFERFLERNTSVLLDLVALPGWNRASPPGPARAHRWLKKATEMLPTGRVQELQEQQLHEARNFLMKLKSVLPISIEKMVHYMLEIRLKKIIIHLGHELEQDGLLALPPCRWLTVEQIRKLEYQNTDKGKRKDGKQGNKKDRNASGAEGNADPPQIEKLKVTAGESRDKAPFPDHLLAVEKIAINQAGFIFQAYKVCCGDVAEACGDVEEVGSRVLVAVRKLIKLQVPDDGRRELHLPQFTAAARCRLHDLVLVAPPRHLPFAIHQQEAKHHVSDVPWDTDTHSVLSMRGCCSAPLTALLSRMQAANDEPVTTQTAEKTIAVITIILNFGIIFLPVFLWSFQYEIGNKLWRYFIKKDFASALLKNWEVNNTRQEILSLMKSFVLYPATLNAVDPDTLYRDNEQQPNAVGVAGSLVVRRGASDNQGEAQTDNDEITPATVQ
eukprot:757100-Hanusia_phi.AAC.3